MFAVRNYHIHCGELCTQHILIPFSFPGSWSRPLEPHRMFFSIIKLLYLLNSISIGHFPSNFHSVVLSFIKYYHFLLFSTGSFNIFRDSLKERCNLHKAQGNKWAGLKGFFRLCWSCFRKILHACVLRDCLDWGQHTAIHVSNLACHLVMCSPQWRGCLTCFNCWRRD